MRKKLLLLIGLIVSCGMMAAPVTLQQAQQRAQQFMNSRGSASTHHGMRLAKQQLRVETAQQDNAYYYVFNVGEQQGFVIVSGDDRTPAILGYADQGSFADQDMPDNMRAWLQGYEDQMKWMDQSDYQAAPAKKVNGVRSSISPLLTCTWNQRAPYNNETPIYNGANCLTGCVATAMAQVMYYHKWPEDFTTSIPSYFSNTALGTLPELSPVKFNWAGMYDNYDNGESGDAVAKLMRYCGQSVEMNYGTGSSGAVTTKVAPALKTYFNYDNTTRLVEREDYTAEEWSEIIYTELKEARPVLYGGRTSKSGHEFVIDGYSEDELFHFNWGWGGSCNGYFLLAVANPYNNTGAGASGSTDGYSFDQDAIIGIQRQQGTPAPVLLLTAVGLAADDLSVTRTSTSDDFSVSMSIGTRNYTEENASFDFGVGVFDSDDNLLSAYTRLTSYELDAGGYGFSNLFAKVTFGADLQDGDYLLKNISRPAGTETWYKSHNADTYVVYATISGNSLTLVNPSLSLSGSDITAEGTMEKGSIINLNTNITNNGTFFNGYLYLFVDGTLAGGKIFEVDGGDTKPFTIEYIPTSAGTKTLKICTDKAGTNVIATGNITVITPEGGTATNNVELTLPTEVVNKSTDSQYVYGTTLYLKTTATNSTSANYNGYIDIQLYKWTRTGTSWSYEYADIDSYKNFTVSANSTTTLDFAIEGLEEGGEYSIRVVYYKNEKWIDYGNYITTTFIVKPGYTYYDVEGNTAVAEATASISTDATTAFVDLRGQTTVQNVASQANPNTIFLLDNDASISGATNVVKGNAAESITLTDGYDFFTPIAFTANSISYSRTAKLTFNRTQEGWATVTLPFKVDSVKVDDETIDWFHSNTDTGKNFWVMEFAGDNSGTVNFDYANEMKAYTPYIFTVPGDSYGAFSLKNKTLVFTGSDAKIKASSDASAVLTGSSYKFIGTTSAKSNLADVYLLDATGSTFKKTDGSEKSFRAYFADTKNQSAANVLGISIGGGTPTGIADMLPAADKQIKAGVYNLNGVKMGDSLETLPAGIYVINGKKVIK